MHSAARHPQASRPLRQLLISAALLGLPAAASAHPGPLDDNGGHYGPGGGSYHCHIGGSSCQQPDTFSRGSRDSFFFDPESRDRFFNEADWPMFEGNSSNCRSTRQTILVLTSRSPVRFTNPRECEARLGDWLDEYTGKRFEVASQLELDHIIPRRYAHSHGGDRWSPRKKFEFANDPLNLILVERREARRKGDSGPSRYLPREEYQCSYARQWQSIAEKYDLNLANQDRNRIRAILRDCGEGDAPAPIDESRQP